MAAAAGGWAQQRVELIKGEIIEMTSKGPAHSFVGGSLADRCAHSHRGEP